jgi:phage terminase large subunit GpA-like protein
LMKRDRYRCCVPGCDNRLWLHVHHLKYHCRGGATVPENLVVLCSACHRLIHAGKLRVVGEAPGSLVFSDVHGRRLGEFVPYELRPG